MPRSDSKVGHVAGQLLIQRPMKSLRDLRFDEVCSGNMSERHSGERVMCVSSYVVIACAADVQITLPLNSLARTNIWLR